MSVLHPWPGRKVRPAPGPCAYHLPGGRPPTFGHFVKCCPLGREARVVSCSTVCATGGKHVRNHPDYGVTITRDSIP
jgi:hypothetical protein